MLSVVSSAGAGLLIGAEHGRGLGGPGPMAGDALHQLQQSDIALVQVLDVLGRERQAGQGRARAKFLDRWWGLAFRHVASFQSKSCKRHAASFTGKAQALAWGLHNFCLSPSPRAPRARHPM